LIFFSDGGPIATFSTYFNLDIIKTTLGDLGTSIKNTLFNPANWSIWDLLLGPLFLLVKIVETLFGTLFFLGLAAAGVIIAQAFLIGYLLPTFNVLVFVQTARGLSKAFGEEIDISSLTRLI